MPTVPSIQQNQPVSSSPAGTDTLATAPVVLGERSLLVMALVRIFVGYLWFQQLFWKLPPSFGGLHRFVVEEAQFTFVPGYSSIINNIFLPNFFLLGLGTFIAELLVAISLLFGIYSRLGALLSVLLAVQLYVGLAVARGTPCDRGQLELLGSRADPVVSCRRGRRRGVDDE